MGSSAFSLVGGAFVVVLVAGFYVQKSLPPPPPKLVGIDLGTTYSCVGAYQAITGNVIIFEDENHHKCIPSIVGFRDDGVLVGIDALQQLDTNAANTIYDAKRFIGKKFSQEELDTEAQRYQFKMVLDEDKFVKFLVNYRGKQVRVAPDDIGGHIISHLKSMVNRNVTSPTRAVISVPAEFSELQRNTTVKAAHRAGYDILRVINEPTAAALAYGLHKKSGVHNVLVVDLGGGTLDVSLLAIQGGMFITQAMAGNNHLGGQDFNENLMKYIRSLIDDNYSGHLSDPEDLQHLRSAVEEAKKSLTSHKDTIIHLKLQSISSKGLTDFKLNMTRQQFEDLNSDLFERVLEPIDAVLKYAELDRNDVNEIVMVGGSTRIPKIRSIVSEYFQGKSLNTEIDADLAVVSGVSIQAGIIGGMWPLTVSAIEVMNSVAKIHL